MATKKNNPFQGKKVTIMGLGLLGGALNDALFLLKHGARLTITDLKSAGELAPSIAKLKRYEKQIEYLLGEHRLRDFKDVDFVLQPGNVPLNSPYLAEAKKNKIPIHVSESLFAQYIPVGVKLVGVTGTRGKSTTTQLIYEILRVAFGDKKVFLAGNVKNVSTLALLDQVKTGDIVVLELDSWALHGMGNMGKSPNIAVFTNFMLDHQNFYGGGGKGMDLYFQDKSQIFLNQKEGDSLVAGEKVAKLIRGKFKKTTGMMFTPDIGIIPKNWKVHLLGKHNLENIAYAIVVAHLLAIKQGVIKKVVENYHGVPGRLEFVREVKGVRYYNDTTATTPDGAIAALRAIIPTLKKDGEIILLGGGADKALDFREFVKEIKKAPIKTLILFKGSATDKILDLLKAKSYNLKAIHVVESMKDAMEWAKKYATKGDVVLLSPGAASFGVFANEFDRGQKFNDEVKKIK